MKKKRLVAYLSAPPPSHGYLTTISEIGLRFDLIMEIFKFYAKEYNLTKIITFSKLTPTLHTSLHNEGINEGEGY